MSQQRETWLESLVLKNFRKFETFEATFHKELTVLVAENGGGKTAILDGIAIALRYFANGFTGIGHDAFQKSDVRLQQAPNGSMVPMLPTVFEAIATFNDQYSAWRRELPTLSGATTGAKSDSLSDTTHILRLELQDYAQGKRTDPPDLPIIAYYGTSRVWGDKGADTQALRGVVDLVQPLSAYIDCLPASSVYDQFNLWFEMVVREAQNEVQSGIASPHRPSQLLAATRKATDVVLAPSGWKRLDWDFLANKIVAQHDVYGRLPVSSLSDGIRNLLALVADLSHRAVRLNPHLGDKACEESTGIVLIDEVDMHLHPSWQQTVVGLLHEAFPRVQFILTTHSHLVISSVPSECIRVIGDDGSVVTPSIQVQGTDSPYALALVFNVDSMPPIAIVKTLATYRRLIEQGEGDSEEALKLREELLGHYGPSHPTMLGIDSLIRMERFRRSRTAKEG